MTQQNYPIIGRREFIDFPELGFTSIEAKVDTGAYTSSIHCHSIEINGDSVNCVFLDPEHPEFTGESKTFEIIKKVKVRSSNGEQEERAMINTSVNVLGQTYNMRLTLTDRSDMRYPVLIGRFFLKKKFLVDVTRINQSTTL